LNRAHPLANKLIGCWLFNEGGGAVVHDLSGFGNNGALVNMVSTDWVQGADGPALSFTAGSSDYVNCGSKDVLDDLHAGAFSFLIFARMDSWDSDKDFFLYKSSGATGWRFQMDSDIGLQGNVYTDSVVASSQSGTDDWTADGVWRAIVFTFDNTGDRKIHIYVDGKEIESYLQQFAATGTYASAASQSMWIGGNATTRSLHGPVGFVYLWNRVLTDVEIAELYRHPYAMFHQPLLVATVVISGTVAWGHDTGVTEDNIRDFTGNWTGTGTIWGSGDAEYIHLNAGEYMESEVVNTGVKTVELSQNLYDVSGDDVTLKYRHGASVAACLAASYTTYSAAFLSLGYVQVRLESTL
jgi:hypothetical protein